MSPLAELLAVLAAILLAPVLARLSLPLVRRADRALSAIGSRRWLSMLLVGSLALAIDIGMGLAVHWPVPAIEDGFSFLLISDTFNEGRLSNPTHPLWEHFESWHIFHQPTYQSKFPPGHGAAMALGQFVFGHPIVGVWLSVGLACGALCWMAYAWVPPRWALVTGLLATCHVGIVRYWGHHYVGGSVTMLGGALLFGALPRLIRRHRLRDALLLSLGLAILANTRPYEGLAASLPASVLMAAWLAGKHRPAFTTAASRVVLPIAAVLAVTAAAMGYYNFRVTGEWTRMPYERWYEIYRGRSSLAPLLSSVGVSRSADTERRRLSYGPPGLSAGPGDKRVYFERKDPRDVSKKLQYQWGFYVRLILTPALLVLPWGLRNRWLRFASVTVVCVLTANLLSTVPGHAHYTAPVAVLIFVLLVQGLRHIRLWRPVGQPAGRLLAPALVGLHIFSFAWMTATHWAKQPVPPSHEWSLQRAALQERLAADKHRHVVIVRYGGQRIPNFEWVYNRAEIDAADVIWARDLGVEKNTRLREYYKDRKIWLLEVMRTPRRLVPYRFESS